MKIKVIATLVTSALLTVGLIPSGFAQDNLASAQEGIEVITVVGKRSTPEGIEVITVVGKRPAPSVASTCVNAVMSARTTDNLHAAGLAADTINAQSPDSLHADRTSVRQAIKDCIDQAQAATTNS